MLMQVGRVVFVNYGPCAGKLAVVLDIIDERRMLVAGPTTGVDRQVMPMGRLDLTKFRINAVLRNQKESVLKANIEKFGLAKRWAETGKAKRLAAAKTRASNSDFNRFKAMVLKRKLSATVRKWVKNNI